MVWKSDNESVATVKNGVVTGKKDGYCTITASSIDGGSVHKSIKIKVRVQKPVDPIDKDTPIVLDDGLSVDAKVKRYLASFTNTGLAREIKRLFTSNAIVKIMDDGVIVNRRNASDYIDIVSNSSIIQKIKFVDMKVNSDNKITELTVEEVFNN